MIKQPKFNYIFNIINIIILELQGKPYIKKFNGEIREILCRFNRNSAINWVIVFTNSTKQIYDYIQNFINSIPYVLIGTKVNLS